MAIPSYEEVMLPLLKYAKNGEIHEFAEACKHLAKEFGVSEEEQKLLLPSGKYPIFRSRVGWAKTYLTKAQLLELPTRGSFHITQRGKELLSQDIKSLDNDALNRFAEFRAFRQRPIQEIDLKSNVPATKSSGAESTHQNKTPEELLEYAYLELQRSLIQDLLAQIQRCSAQFFEYLVIDLLVAMGYGGNRSDAAQVVGKTGDGGIDGIIKADPLGLDTVYVQAKRWQIDSTVARPEIDKFIGALNRNGVVKGIFITTARFSKQAREGARDARNCRVILIDGELLANYMIQYNIGVTERQSYKMKAVDSDYFTED